MKRHFSSNSDDLLYGRRRLQPCAACLRSTPWSAFLAAALFGAGLALWIAGAVKIQDYTFQVAEAIQMAESVTNTIKTVLVAVILSIAISGVIVCALVLLLALFRTGLRTALFSTTCCSTSDGPEPWTFTTFRTLVGLLNAFVWLLLLGVVGVLCTMLLWYGASAAINSAIWSSRSAAGAYGISLNRASDSAAAAQAFLGPLVNSPAAAAELLGTSTALTLPFQPLCAPVCLNLGSFAQLLQSASCVCGSSKLDAIANAASQGVRVGAVALAGAGAMYVGATLLLMILTAQFVSAKYDRSTARHRQRKAQRDYENGYFADPADCIEGPTELEAPDVQSQRDVNVASPPAPVYGSNLTQTPAYPPVRPAMNNGHLLNPFAAK